MFWGEFGIESAIHEITLHSLIQCHVRMLSVVSQVTKMYTAAAPGRVIAEEKKIVRNKY